MSSLFDLGWPVLFVALAWWVGTGAVLLLVRQSERTYAVSLAGTVAATAVALYAIAETRDQTSATAAMIAFAATIVVWALVEMSFLMGMVTGPRTTACPAGAAGWARFAAAWQVVAYHEVALVIALGALYCLTSDSPNRMAVDAFSLLWLLRLSAKLNVFTGVSNLPKGMLPARMDYIESYFRKSSLTFLFALTVTLATIATTLLTARAVAAPAGSGDAAAFAMLAALGLFGVIEHWFLVTPIAAERLWLWRTDAADTTQPPERATGRRRGGDAFVPASAPAKT